MDQGGYLSEEILSTSHFRVYRSLGGDSIRTRPPGIRRARNGLPDPARRRLADADQQPLNPGAFPERACRRRRRATGPVRVSPAAPTTRCSSWAFEKQNLNGGAPARRRRLHRRRSRRRIPVPAGTLGQRLGVEPPQCRRHAGAPGTRRSASPTTPIARSRTAAPSIANDVTSAAITACPRPASPGRSTSQPMTTASIRRRDHRGQRRARSRSVGPFSWTPNANAWGHDCMLMIASATGDPSNVDSAQPRARSVADWRLVPHDNNVGQRNVDAGRRAGRPAGIIAEPAEARASGSAIPSRKAATDDGQRSPCRRCSRAPAGSSGCASLPDGGLRMKPRRTPARHLRSRRPVAAIATAEAMAVRCRPRHHRRPPPPTARSSAAWSTDSTRNWKRRLATVRPPIASDRCRDQAQALLECLDIPKARVKRTRVRKVVVDIEIDGGECCD